ncbi:hypothetical protein PANO111632_02710 [Paracoccus nototheniae]|uniref:Uncharacterized protein n=1 Tax=Paracoccus nototheniae TaxID=2489002 RepID=A0ABW4DZE8_9RHOB|nr:hypothetical protein [Paracoccus nototheniae]
MIIGRITLPWTKTSRLSMNARTHWRTRHRLVKYQKFVADTLGREAGWHKLQLPEEGDIRVVLTCCPPAGVQYPDDDNLITAQKGALDALAAVLRVNDRRFKVQEPVRGDRCKDGAVIVEMTIAAETNENKGQDQ